MPLMNAPDTEAICNPQLEECHRLMVVTGVSGSGKDYLITAFKERSEIKVEVVNFGQELFERAQALLPALSSRDDLSREFSRSDLYPIIEELACDIRSRGAVVLNTHVVYKQGEALIINPVVEKQIGPDLYVFVQADPAQIVDWREKDTTRDRLSEEVTAIDLHQKIARSTTAFLAEYVGAQFVMIENTPETLDLNWRVLEENAVVSP